MKQITTAFLLFISFAAFAQNEGEISGVVKDKDSHVGIPSAYMKLSQNGVKLNELVTSDNGEFVFKPLQPGKYDITIISLGYDTAQFNGLVVSARGLNFQEFELAYGLELLPVTILPSLVDADNPETGITISGKDLGNRAIDNALEGAAQAPAVQLSEKTGGISVGGSREDATLYVVDGVKVIGSLYVPMNAIKEINVITGGIPAAYGDFTGGIIEITTLGYSGAY